MRSKSIQVGVLVALSRILGLVRDALLAGLLGAGWVADAYTTALRIPNMLRDLLGEGALSSVVVSRLGVLKKEPERLKRFLPQLMGFWMLILIGVSLLGVAAAPLLVGGIAHGFEDLKKIELSVTLTRIIFPYIAVVGLAAMTMGVLHHLKVFGWSTSSSSFSNVAVIALMLAGAFFWGEDPVLMAHWIALSVVLAGFAQWCSQWPGLRGSGLSLVPSFRFRDPELKKILILLGPSVISVAAVQINVIVNHGFASTLGDGAPASIYFSFRLMQLPVGVVAVAVSTVLLPTLTEKVQKADLGEINEAMVKAIFGVSFLSFPAVVGLGVLGPDLISMLYERGQFGAQDTQLVWLALQGYLIGIIPYGYNKSLIQGYFSRSDTRFPVWISMASIFVNAGINAWFVYGLGWGTRGLTLGTSLVLCLNTFLLAAGLRYKYGMEWPLGKIALKLLPMVMLSLLMGWIVWWGGHLPFFLAMPETVKTLVLVALGAAVYLGVWLALKRFLRWDIR